MDAGPRQARQAPAAPPKAASRPITSTLPGMLKGLNHQGWEDLGCQTFRIVDGKLIPFDSSSHSQNASQSFILPVGGNEVLILEECTCQSLAQKVFKRGGRFITVKAFEFEKSIGANAGYDLLRKGSTTVVKRGDGSSEDSDSISFWQDKFLFVIAGTAEDDDEAKEVITKFAQRLSALAITHAQPPVILNKLPVIDRVRGTEKVVMGPISAARYFPAPELGALFLDTARAAAVADYQMLQPFRERLKLLYIDYGDDTQAQRAFSSFAESLSELHDPEKDQEDGRLLYKVNKTFLFCELRPQGRVILITGARKAKSPVILARQINR